MSPTILVVDDERDITSFVAELLTDEGYVVRVLLDVAMPGMSGTTVLRELRASEFASLPVIMATAGLHTQALVDEGATDVLAKPFAIEQLLEAIERYAERS
jgi:two-component system OmpR family response regulator